MFLGNKEITNALLLTGACVDDAQCPSDRLCINSRCMCTIGFVDRDGICINIDGMHGAKNSPKAHIPFACNMHQITQISPATFAVQCRRCPLASCRSSLRSAALHNRRFCKVSTSTASRTSLHRRSHHCAPPMVACTRVPRDKAHLIERRTAKR